MMNIFGSNELDWTSSLLYSVSSSLGVRATPNCKFILSALQTGLCIENGCEHGRTLNLIRQGSLNEQFWSLHFTYMERLVLYEMYAACVIIVSIRDVFSRTVEYFVRPKVTHTMMHVEKWLGRKIFGNQCFPLALVLQCLRSQFTVTANRPSAPSSRSSSSSSSIFARLKEIG
jgi:hypothetical protein